MTLLCIAILDLILKFNNILLKNVTFLGRTRVWTSEKAVGLWIDIQVP
jgi:hypothetical protein